MPAYPPVGALTQRVTVQREGTPGADGGGGYAQAWATFAAGVPAKIEAAQARENILGQKLAEIVSHAVTIRHLEGVAAGMRLVFGSRVFNIRGVVDLEERRRFMVLACEEGVAT